MKYSVTIYSPARTPLRTIEFDYIRAKDDRNYSELEYMQLKGKAVSAIISDIAEDIQIVEQTLIEFSKN